MANHNGTRWRGKIPIPPHCHPFVRELIVIANEQQTTMREIATRAGLRECTIGNWRYKCKPGLEGLQAALNVLGYELHIRKQRA